MTAKNEGRIKWAVSVGAVLVALGVAWGTLTKDVNYLNTEGCKPAREHITDIALIQQSIKSIDTTQKEMREEWTTGQEAIIKAINER